MAYKWQHNVPCAYLRNWSFTTKNRKGSVWKLTKTERAWGDAGVKLVKECADDHFYSAKYPKDVESALQQLEDEYTGYSDRVRDAGGSADVLTLEELGNVTQALIFMLVRNPINSPYLGKEEIELTLVRWQGAREMLKKQRWTTTLIKAPTGSSFIAGDCPAVPLFCDTDLATDDARKLMFIMPQSPTHAWIASCDGLVNSARNSTATPADMALINRLVAAHAQEAVFGESRLADISPVLAGFDQPHTLHSEIRDGIMSDRAGQETPVSLWVLRPARLVTTASEAQHAAYLREMGQTRDTSHLRECERLSFIRNRSSSENESPSGWSTYWTVTLLTPVRELKHPHDPSTP